ncbi:MAG TPA: class I SAM-dependent methyltransferase, partial [Polyangiaceae bacterium]|nr:class I SAM-dependent methyltransferase [Polyangiaceae bacterium]
MPGQYSNGRGGPTESGPPLVMSKSETLVELFLHLTFNLVADDAFDHLHWGLWRDLPEDPRRFGEARQAYADELVSWVPREATRVLDVGCGLGGIARMLAERGHQVTAITPRADHHQRLVEHPVDGLDVRCTRFEDLHASDGPFDLVLFGESFN